MKKYPGILLRLVFLSLLIGSFLSCQSASDNGKLYYAIESEGVVYGYVERTIRNVEDPATPEITVKEEIKSISTALGMTLNTEVLSEYHMDPATGRFDIHANHSESGITHDINDQLLRLGQFGTHRRAERKAHGPRPPRPGSGRGCPRF